ncbi:MAG: SDR family NAD(P)-dependent oxidoreductase, partial [Acidobacteriaceae bacterium]|nr:SDR family NAD(P)-dependent oxidoreductase [Acidobacteriaceae bacterium]
MPDSLDGKKAIVTGGSKGIGLEVARSLVSHGAQVLICGREEAALERARASLNGSANGKSVVSIAADVSDSQQVERMFQFADSHLGGLDILINNAGLGIFRATGELSVEEWNRVIGVNLSGAFYCSRAAIERFQQHGTGWIINISSLAGKNPFAGGSAYNASKFGL